MFIYDMHEQEILEMDCLLDQLRATRRAKQAPLKVIVLYNGSITYLKLTKEFLNYILLRPAFIKN